MAKTKISEYSSTANSNTDIASINIDEGCAPSGINNAIRALMAQLKDFQTGAASDPVTVGGVLTVTGGSAAAPAITTSGDTNTGVLFPAADTVGVTTGGTERVRVDSSGNVGIGTSSPVVALDVYGAVNLRAGYNLTWGGTYASNKPTIFADTNYIAFAPVGASSGEKMRIDSSGNLLVGTTSNSDFSSTLKFYSVSSTYAGAFKTTGGASYECLGLWNTATSGTIYQIKFYDGGAGVRGSISTNGTSTSFNTSSDYRLKENIAPMTGALDVVSQLKPVTYTWKSNGAAGQGFIAHELQAVVPDAVIGEKDAVDAEGKPQYQGIDTSFLVATLTAAIQELKATVDAQAARITALEQA